jgi:hypothetical protein
MNAEMRDFAIREIGDIVARIRGDGFEPCEKHHLLTTGLHGNGKRRGEKATVGLSPWRHRGVLLPGFTEEAMTEKFGPSLARHAREFRATYPDGLLLETQNEWIAKWKRGEVTCPSP